jgi:hypothetical protein
MIPMSGSNVSGAPPGASHLRGYYEDKGPLFFNDVVSEPREREPEPARKPEPLLRVTVLAPYMVAHEGARWFPGETAEVPESLADDWILNQWVIPEDPREKPEAVSDAVKETRKRGNRPQPE